VIRDVLVTVLVAAALHMACVIQQKDARQWFAELAVDLEKVWICVLDPEGGSPNTTLVVLVILVVVSSLKNP